MNKNDSDTEEEDREADRHNNFDEIEKALRECGRKLWIDFTEQAQTSKFWIELLALVILGVYTTFSALQWYEMRIATEKAGISAEAAQGQLGILQKQLEALDRPWVSIDMSVASPLTYGITSGIQVNFNLVPENIGKSPAQNVWIEARLIQSMTGYDVIGIEKNICEHNAAKTRIDMFPGYPIFPGRHFTQPMSFQLSMTELESFWAMLDIREPHKRYDIVPITLVGCVDYMFEASPRHHQTGFAVDVLMKDRRLVLISKTPLAPESIDLVAHALGGDTVN